jgi:phosphopantothenoylcysteine decarboxylase/phosphopantothenate--cysteine ligase
MKRKSGEAIQWVLTPNPDIAASLGKIKKEDQILIGFALETDHEIENAKAKLQQKNLDCIVLNSLKDEGAGFRSNTNKITMIDVRGKVLDFPMKLKTEVAKDIIDVISEWLLETK